MVSTLTFRESRRSTRVPLKVVIAIEDGAESRTCEGETVVVNLHGALIATAIELSSGMRISIRVYLTDKRAAARVVYIDPENPLQCGIELTEPRNIWGVPLPPDDWEETGAFEIRH
jgi:PilZ domain